MAQIRIDMKLNRLNEAEKCLATARDLYRAMNIEKDTEELQAVAKELADLLK
jgi:hypothetical protein